MDRPDLERAVAKATEILGYPCPCEQCSPDGGVAKAKEIMDLAYDLAGVIPGDADGSTPTRP
jgi:hypothetical protein